MAKLSVGGCRGLFAAVVLQALHDLREEPYGSTDYAQSVAFFTRPGPWAEWRGEVADMLELHPDDLVRVGWREIIAREARDPPPPPVERDETPIISAIPLIVRPAPEPPRKRPARRRMPPSNEGRGEWVRRFARSGLSAHLPD